MANHTIRFTNKEDASLQIVLNASNAEQKALNPAFVDETQDKYLERIMKGVAASWAAIQDQAEIDALAASYKAANQAKRDAAKAALQ